MLQAHIRQSKMKPAHCLFIFIHSTANHHIKCRSLKTVEREKKPSINLLFPILLLLFRFLREPAAQNQKFCNLMKLRRSNIVPGGLTACVCMCMAAYEIALVFGDRTPLFFLFRSKIFNPTDLISVGDYIFFQATTVAGRLLLLLAAYAVAAPGMKMRLLNCLHITA